MHTLPTPSFHHSLSSPRRTKKKTSHPVRPRPHRPTSPSCSSSSPSPLHPSLASAPHPFPPTRRPRSPPRPLPPLAVSPSVPHILHARARSRAARRTSLARRAGHNLPCVRSALPSPSPSCRRSLSLPPASPPFPSSAAPLHQRHLSRPVVSRLRFASSSNNLMASSWDSGLRLYDVDSFARRSRRRRFSTAASRMSPWLSQAVLMDL